MYNISTFTVTHDRDLYAFIKLSESFRKFCKNYKSHVVALDTHLQDCENSLRYFKEEGVEYILDKEAEKIPHGHIRQQYIKFNSDKYVSDDTDWICHVDSNCVFFESHDASTTYFFEGKPVMEYEEISTLKDQNPSVVDWAKLTSNILKLPDTIYLDFSRRKPLIYPKWLFVEIRDWFLKNYGISFLDYCRTTDQISEYNILGTYCWYYHRYLYHWVDINKEGVRYIPLLQKSNSIQCAELENISEMLVAFPEVHLKAKSIFQARSQNKHIDYRDGSYNSFYNQVLFFLYPEFCKNN